MTATWSWGAAGGSPIGHCGHSQRWNWLDPARDDLDSLLLGAGWPAFRGGPVRYAYNRGLPVLVGRAKIWLGDMARDSIPARN